VANLAEEEGGEDDGEERLGGLDGVREGDGDLAQAHVGEHRAQHVPHGQRRDLAQLQPQKLYYESANHQGKGGNEIAAVAARMASPAQRRAWAPGGAWWPT